MTKCEFCSRKVNKGKQLCHNCKLAYDDGYEYGLKLGQLEGKLAEIKRQADKMVIDSSIGSSRRGKRINGWDIIIVLLIFEIFILSLKAFGLI